MASREGPRRHGAEAAGLQQGAELRQGIFISPVSKGHHGDSQGSLSPEPGLEIRGNFVGHPARVGGRAHNDQLPFSKAQVLPPLFRLRKAPAGQGQGQFCRQGLRQRMDHFASHASGAVIDGRHLPQFHKKPPSWSP